LSYIERHLLPGEVVTFRTHLHWKIFVAPACAAVVLVAGALWALSANRVAVAIAPAAVAVIVLLVPWLRRVNSEFAVTNKRVIIKLGVLSTRSLELLLSKVEAITVTQPLTGRLFGYGEIMVTGSGGTQERFDNIQSPLDFRQAVQAATSSGE